MSNTKKIRRALKLFNEKADELVGSPFIQRLTHRDSGVTLTFSSEQESRFERRGPSKLEIKGFVLDFRCFIQDNEQSSFRNIAKVYESPLCNESFKRQFQSARDGINQFLDSNNRMNINHNNEILTNRKIMDTFVYGGLAHANEQKEAIFKSWMSVPPFAPLVENEFVFILANVLKAIVYIKGVNERVLVKMQEDEKPKP